MLRITLISILICLTYLTTPTSSASKYYEGESRPYEFGFKIENNQHRYEKRDENGLIMGEFGFVTADGIYHATVYATDEKGSFQIVSMQNLKITEIADVFNIPRAAPKSKFEIVPLKATIPLSYTIVATTPKPNIPVIQSKPLDKKTCSNCLVPTTQRPIPITFAPLQRNTHKLFGIGLPEKLTKFPQFDVTPNPIVSSINSVELPTKSQPGIKDEYTQIRAPEDQTQPIRKSSLTSTQSSFTGSPLQKLQPQPPQRVPPTTGTQVNIKSQSPENVRIIQNVDATKPSLGSIPESISNVQPQSPEHVHKLVQLKSMIPPSFQSPISVSPVPELSQTIQPSLLDNDPVEQPQAYIKPSTETEFQFSSPVTPVRESNQRTPSEISPNLPGEQPAVYSQVSPPTQTKLDHPASSIRGSVQFVQPQFLENIPAERPKTSKQPFTSKQNHSKMQTSPIRESISNFQSQTPQNLPAIDQHQVYKNNLPPTPVQRNNSASPVQESTQSPQSKLRQNKPAEQAQKYTKLIISSQDQFERPVSPVRDSLQNLEPQPKQDVPIEQPSVINRPSAPIQNQFIAPVSLLNGHLQNPQPQQPPNSAIDQPTISNSPSKPTQIRSDGSPSPIKESIPISQPILTQLGEVDQFLVYPEPTQPTLTKSQNTPDPEIDPLQPSQVQFEKPASPARGSLQNLEPQSPRDVSVEQPAVLNRPSAQIRNKFINPVSSFDVDLQKSQPQSSPNSAIEQPSISTVASPSPIRQSIPILPPNGGVDQPLVLQEASKPTFIRPQSLSNREKEFVPKLQPQISQNIPSEQPTVYRKLSTATQVRPGYPVEGFMQNIQPQLPIQQPPVLTSASPQSQTIIPTANKIDRTVPLTANEIIVTGAVGEVNKYPVATKDVKGKVLVVEPLSPAPEVRINLPKQLLNSSQRQIAGIVSTPTLPKLSDSLLNEMKESMLKYKNKAVQSGAQSLEPIGQFDKEFNIAKMEEILSNILYRFNYTAGYHGHHEHGDHDGNKEGGYYVISRDGYRRTVDYTANEDGYRPKVHIEYSQPQVVPQEETEKEKGLAGYEFKWFYVR